VRLYRKELPDNFDPAHLADEGMRLEGDLPMGRLPRLAALCAEPGGGTRVVMDFERTTDGKRIMRLRADAQAVFECGRCLGKVAVSWRAESVLVIRRSAEASDSTEEDTETLIADGPVSLRDVVEDELLLAVPMFPVHADPCGSAEPGSPADARRGEDSPRSSGPFATLARLKKVRK
jgi:uncharacterized protein